MTNCFRGTCCGTPNPRYAFFAVLACVLAVTTAGCGGGDDESAQTASAESDSRWTAPVPAVAGDTLAVATDSLSGGSAVIADPSDPARQTAAVPPGAETTPAPDDAGPVAKTAPPGGVTGPRAMTAPVDLGPYCLQVGSFRRTLNAERRLARLAESGVNAFIEVATVGGLRYHRVCVPNLPDQAAARRLGDTLYAEYGFAYLIRKE
jgi:cell division protein FtsN